MSWDEGVSDGVRGCCRELSSMVSCTDIGQIYGLFRHDCKRCIMITGKFPILISHSSISNTLMVISLTLYLRCFLLISDHLYLTEQCNVPCVSPPTEERSGNGVSGVDTSTSRFTRGSKTRSVSSEGVLLVHPCSDCPP